MIKLVHRAIVVLIAAVLMFQVGFVGSVEASIVSYYVSPSYGYSLAFDPASWTVTTDLTDAGYDLVILTNGTTEVVLEGAGTRAADAESCVYDELSRLSYRDDVADLALRFEQPAWAGDFTGYVLGYTYTQHADSTEARAAAGLKWCGLIDDGTSLVVTQISPQSAIATESAIVSELLQGLRG